MERTAQLLLGLEALPASSLLLCFGAIIRVNKGFLNTNTAIMWELTRTPRTLEAEWGQVLWESVGTGPKEGVKYWEHLGCWILPCYGLFSLGTRFEIYEPFISSIFQFFGGPW